GRDPVTRMTAIARAATGRVRMASPPATTGVTRGGGCGTARVTVRVVFPYASPPNGSRAVTFTKYTPATAVPARVPLAGSIASHIAFVERVHVRVSPSGSTPENVPWYVSFSSAVAGAVREACGARLTTW